MVDTMDLTDITQDMLLDIMEDLLLDIMEDMLLVMELLSHSLGLDSSMAMAMAMAMDITREGAGNIYSIYAWILFGPVRISVLVFICNSSPLVLFCPGYLVLSCLLV